MRRGCEAEERYVFFAYAFLNSVLIPTPHYPHRTKEQRRTMVATAERRQSQERYVLGNTFLDSDIIPTPHYHHRTKEI